MTKYIIDFEDNAAPIEIQQYFTTNACTVITEFTNLNKVYLVESNTLPPTDKIVTSVINDDTTTITLMSTVTSGTITVGTASYPTTTITNTDEKEWWKIYSLDYVDFSTTTTRVDVRSSDNVVYLLDSGVDTSHPEFANKRIEPFYSFTGEYADTAGHGTALASVITGNTCSINDCIVKVVKIFDKNQNIKQSELLTAFSNIAADVIANQNRVNLLNISWSIPRNPYIEQKIQLLLALGAQAIVSAGNAGIPIEDVTPAAMKDVIVIGSYNVDFRPSTFSDYGTTVTTLTNGDINYGELDGWAPGEQIWVATPGGSYGFTAGTSISAAIHSAVSMYNSCSQLANSNKAEYLAQSTGISSELLVNLSLSRNGLLDLSNPKYSMSPNRISTFRFDLFSRQTKLVFADTHSVCAVNQIAFIRLFTVSVVSKVEILTPLPDWCAVADNMFFMKPTVEPTNPTGVDQFSFSFKITPLEGDPFTRTITAVVLSSTFNRDTLPPGDPLLDITLQALCVGACSPSSCGGTCSVVKSVCGCH